MSTKSTEVVQPEGNYYDKYHSTNPIVKWMMKGFKVNAPYPVPFLSFEKLR